MLRAAGAGCERARRKLADSRKLDHIYRGRAETPAYGRAIATAQVPGEPREAAARALPNVDVRGGTSRVHQPGPGGVATIGPRVELIVAVNMAMATRDEVDILERLRVVIDQAESGRATRAVEGPILVPPCELTEAVPPETVLDDTPCVGLQQAGLESVRRAARVPIGARWRLRARSLWRNPQAARETPSGVRSRGELDIGAVVENRVGVVVGVDLERVVAHVARA
jgi:hypothetical protein